MDSEYGLPHPGIQFRNERLDYANKKPAIAYADGRLDRGIKRVVEALQGEGIDTYESCEGGTGHTYPYPAVRFRGTYGDGFKALAVAYDFGFPVKRLNRFWRILDGEPEGPDWELELYRPVLD